MTSIWDTHAGVAHRLSTDWNPAVALRLKESLTTIYGAIKDRPEYDDQLIRYSPKDEFEGLSLKGAFQRLLFEEVWDQSLMEVVYTFVGGDLHDFDHRDLPLGTRKTYGHHTEAILAKLPKKLRDKIPGSYYQFGYTG